MRVGPSGIGARRSPLGAQPAGDGVRRLALARRDPRVAGLFGAAWAIGHYAAYAAAGAVAVSLLALRGDAGVLGADDDGAPCPRPVFHALAALRTAGAAPRVEVDDPRCAAVALRRDDGTTELVVANLTAAPVRVALPGEPHAVATLDVGALRACGGWLAVPSDAPGGRVLPELAILRAAYRVPPVDPLA